MLQWEKQWRQTNARPKVRGPFCVGDLDIPLLPAAGVTVRETSALGDSSSSRVSRVRIADSRCNGLGRIGKHWNRNSSYLL